MKEKDMLQKQIDDLRMFSTSYDSNFVNNILEKRLERMKMYGFSYDKGDRVKVINCKENPILNGKIGTIVKFESMSEIPEIWVVGIKFDFEHESLHNLRFGYKETNITNGYYLYPNEFEYFDHVGKVVYNETDVKINKSLDVNKIKLYSIIVNNEGRDNYFEQKDFPNGKILYKLGYLEESMLGNMYHFYDKDTLEVYGLTIESDYEVLD